MTNLWILVKNMIDITGHVMYTVNIIIVCRIILAFPRVSFFPSSVRSAYQSSSYWSLNWLARIISAWSNWSKSCIFSCKLAVTLQNRLSISVTAFRWTLGEHPHSHNYSLFPWANLNIHSIFLSNIRSFSLILVALQQRTRISFS